MKQPTHAWIFWLGYALLAMPTVSFIVDRGLETGRLQALGYTWVFLDGPFGPGLLTFLMVLGIPVAFLRRGANGGSAECRWLLITATAAAAGVYLSYAAVLWGGPILGRFQILDGTTEHAWPYALGAAGALLSCFACREQRAAPAAAPGT